MESAKATSEAIRFVPFGPYRFIGKSVYARSGASDCDRGSGDLFGALWKQSDWIFEELDGLKEYASDEPHNAALMTWDAYTPEDKHFYGITVGKTQLLGYCVGRFMKRDAPVPAGFDYIDIPAGVIAKGWTKGKSSDDALDGMIRDAIERTENYRQASWRFMAEIYPKPDESGVPSFGYYMSCEPLNEEQMAERKRALTRVPSMEDDINGGT